LMIPFWHFILLIILQSLLFKFTAFTAILSLFYAWSVHDTSHLRRPSEFDRTSLSQMMASTLGLQLVLNFSSTSNVIHCPQNSNRFEE
jgi:hypothetical protein